ncbi:histidinol-phosphatase [Paenibacillus sp. MMS18-CY102]|uniref:histidinol-phosphatase n=1 Tax=Paenibacillus sp. MMS18-CY102 TaxID=2682849 RepID=UPI0013657C0D|nr:histidinol-phosphatase [Paenibacillus sp. MMS18-CY102]MWC26827.1 histidinol-phosphatase HisJ family protein [Paenibacillus sp. MMS18-CY102]
MKFDLHTHHYRCGHADGTIEQYIQAGIDAGLQAIGISDHSPFFAHKDEQPFPKIAMARSELKNYVDEVLRLKAKYEGKIDVLLGMESDYFPDHIEVYRQAYAPYPFDYLIGSVHKTRGVSIFNRNRWKSLDAEQQIDEKRHYYELIAQSARTGLFHILGHIDAMKGYYPAFADIAADDAVDEALRVIAECGVAIEINTSGKTKDVGGWYPSDAMLERACHFGVDVTFGSDSHVPSRVGDDWELVQQRLKEIGFRHWVYFKNKERITVGL